MKYNPEIFKAYDVRGKYGEDFDAEFARALGHATAKYLNAKKMVVSRDMRDTSADLATAVVEGITSAGCDVIDIGQTSTPLFYFGVIHEQADGGLMITASHLGPEFNGFKIAREKAITIGGESGAKDIQALLNDQEPVESAGTVTQKNLIKEQTAFAIEHSGLKPGDISLSVHFVANEMVLAELQDVMDALEISVVESDADITFEFDPDADRIMIYGRDGNPVRGDLYGGALADYFFKGQKIAYDIRYSQGVIDYLKSHGTELIPSRVGHTLIKKVMRDNDLEFTGEGSGHMFFKEAGYVESSALAVLKTLRMLHETGKTIDELVAPLNTWFNTYEINVDLPSRDAVPSILEKLKEKYSDGEINEMDGLRVAYGDWNFLVRPSNTEAKLRLIVDAKTEELMNEKREELTAQLSS